MFYEFGVWSELTVVYCILPYDTITVQMAIEYNRREGQSAIEWVTPPCENELLEQRCKIRCYFDQSMYQTFLESVVTACERRA